MNPTPAAGSRPAADTPSPASTPSPARSVLFPALPLARVRALRVLVHAFVMIDVLTFSRDVLSHAGNSGFFTRSRWPVCCTCRR